MGEIRTVRGGLVDPRSAAGRCSDNEGAFRAVYAARVEDVRALSGTRVESSNSAREV
jgi:hypothetical protein